ncbi:MAG: histidine phosphatase family protein [Pirellulales bacterium]|nr:histidine phosphatase family protein [Pirellulales bacterium]
MSILFVVRHGQASFFEDHYDRLSALGRKQSRLLGEYWAARGITFDEVFTGPRERQIDTAHEVGESFRAAGLAWPEPTVLEELDEYQAEAVLKQALPSLLEEHPTLREMYAAVEAAEGRDEKLRTFQRVYEVVIGRWARGELDLPGIEPWAEFRDRVQRGYDRITAEGSSGRRVAAFTSGGPVGVSMERALKLPPETTLQIAWMVRNGSVSEFLFSGNRFTLSYFNSFPHLSEPEMWTYR